MDIRPLLPDSHGSEIIFLTGPEIFRRAERKETIDGLDQHPVIVYSIQNLLGNNQHEKKEW